MKNGFCWVDASLSPFSFFTNRMMKWPLAALLAASAMEKKLQVIVTMRLSLLQMMLLFLWTHLNIGTSFRPWEDHCHKPWKIHALCCLTLAYEVGIHDLQSTDPLCWSSLNACVFLHRFHNLYLIHHITLPSRSSRLKPPSLIRTPYFFILADSWPPYLLSEGIDGSD